MVDWEEILAEHGPMVWRTVYRLLNHDADARDCYQETFVAAYQASRRGPVDHWPAFLISLATRRAIDLLRMRARARERLVPLDGLPEPITKGWSPDEAAHGAELRDHLRDLLVGMPAKQAEVFWLSCIEGLPHDEIGAHLQIRAGEVRVLLHRARNRLRTALGRRQTDGSLKE